MVEERQDLQRQITALKQQVETISISLASAFEKDEEGNPKFVEHKIYHRKEREDREASDKKRSKVVSDVLTWIIIGVLSILAGIFIPGHLPDFKP